MNSSIDGTLTLQVQEDTLGGTENEQFVELTKYEKGDDATTKLNNADFKDADAHLKSLRLVAVGPGETTASVHAAQTAKGRTILFDTTVFVEGAEATVVVCREA